MANNNSYRPEVRKGLISLLMFSMYSEQRTIYREYVQNALDSINNAVNNHILNAHKDGKVEILIDAKRKVVSIKDNGTGIESANAERILLDISSSTKDGITQAGQFGIGRLVGGGFCHKLIFKTAYRGEETGTQITFDVDKIWRMVKVDETDYLASDVISQCTLVEQIDSKAEEHFFEVVLDGIKDDSAPTLLDRDKVIEYLSEVAPVEYTTPFSQALIFNSLGSQPEFKPLYEQLEKVQVFVDSTRVRKQYGLKIKGTKDEINNLEFFKIEDPSYGLLGWGWFALTKFSIQIPKDDTLACIRLRKHNIQIGSSSQLSGSTYWKEERSNSYFYGEFFVTHPNITPSASREGLAPTPETLALNKLLKEYFENLKTLYTKANNAKKCVDKMKEGLERMRKLGGEDYNSKDLIEKKGLALFDKLVKNSSFGPTQRMLALYKKSIDEVASEIDALKAELKAKEEETRKPQPTQAATNEPGSVSEPTPPSENTSTPIPGEPNTPDTNNPSNPSSNTPQGEEVVEGPTPVEPQDQTPEVFGGLFPASGNDNPLSPTTTNLLGNKDIINRLEGVLEPSEVFLVRRIFRVLNTYCPDNEHDKTLVNNLQERIVRELLNG